MSPEQIRGGNIDTRSDIFAVGALLYEVLTYKEAFPGAVHQTMHKILHEEPEPLDSIVPGLDPRRREDPRARDREGSRRPLSGSVGDEERPRPRCASAWRPRRWPTRRRMPLGKDARFSVPPTDADADARRRTVDRRRGPRPARRTRRSGSRPTASRCSGAARSRSPRCSTKRASCSRAGDLDKARDKCDEALMFDPDHPGGLQLMDDIAAESDRQQIAQ